VSHTRKRSNRCAAVDISTRTNVDELSRQCRSLGYLLLLSSLGRSFFLHAMGLVAQVMERMRTSVDAFGHRPRFGKDFQNIGMNWAWKDVVARRKKMAEWRSVKRRNRQAALPSRRIARGSTMGIMAMPS
jgi:hypothetical protein